ncbi:MAG TPA: hypothetical protein VFK10_18000 [Burkholderiaceae bacterium]|nr:hypothetical protein [Burkholderiaceae bacterium]
MALEWLCIVLATVAALAARPWRALRPSGPPWVWLAVWSVLPVLWSADRHAASALLQPWSGASLLVLLAGWPLATLALVMVALVLVALGVFGIDDAASRLVWLGLVPASLALALGAIARRWLPHHLFVYIFARGFFGTVLATAVAGALALWRHDAAAGLTAGDLLLGRWLAAWGEAIVTGMLVAIFVAFRPHWLATYSDTLYLPRR